MLALHHTCTVLQYKSLVHHPLEVLRISGPQSIAQPIIQAVQKTVLLLLISIHFIGSMVRHLSELGNILVRGHGPMFQILEVPLLHLDNPLGNMMCTKSNSKLWPVDAIGFLMGFHVSIPPVGCRTR
jgi:hypothetical protein